MRSSAEPRRQEDLRGHPELPVRELELKQAHVHDTVEF